MPKVRVATLSELGEGRVLRVDAEGRPLIISSLPQRPATIVVGSGEYSCPSVTAADGASRRVPSSKQLNLKPAQSGLFPWTCWRFGARTGFELSVPPIVLESGRSL